MTTSPLGRLDSVPLREVWARESNDFTPWLADEENLTLLADTLNLGPLQLQGTEVAVGNFFIDILARDIGGSVVVIENQFGPTDHTHLGQILTYIAGQDGRATVIWIAEKVREEHRAAIDWLNANTIEGFNFFAVEVEALRIGASPVAPWFNVVAKPNDWSRDILGRSAGKAPMDDRARRYVAYWSGFVAFLQDKGSPLQRVSTSPRDYWCSFRMSRPGFLLVATAGFRDRILGVEIYIRHSAANSAFDLLEAERAEVEAEFGATLDWQRMDDRKACRIAVYRRDMDPNVEAERPRQYEWLLDQMERFSRAFGNRISTLPLADTAAADLGPVSTAADN
jgi:hypothetical protein